MDNSIENIRRQFPILDTKVYGKPLVYLDNAATMQKPLVVIEAIREYYESYNSNVHRGVHYLSQLATERFEGVRRQVQEFIHASTPQEIVFTRGTTESVNLVASSFGRAFISEGDEVLVTVMEHHSNFVPWQAMCRERKARFRVIPVTSDGELPLEELERYFTDRTKLLALTHVSNTLGTVNPVREITAIAHSRGVKVLVDGAQAIPHFGVDVQDLDCDFYCFSGHKMYGPTGIGILYGRKEILDAMPPYQYGGEMISNVGLNESTFNEIPLKFEAGTPDIAGVIGLGAAIDFITATGYENFSKLEKLLVDYAVTALSGIGGLRIVGNPKHRAGVISFNIEGAHPYDVGTIIDKMGFALRTGHHCTQPLMDHLGLNGTLRASFAIYNTLAEIDSLSDALAKASEMLR